MQIKSVRSALITNYEVLRLLEESQEAQKQVQKRDPTVEYPEHLRTVQFEHTNARADIHFMKAISKFELTKAEKLQILNLRPKSTVEIYLLIEECEERFTEEDLEQMLSSILYHFTTR
ncbi:HRDC-like protein [Mucor lusitanicus]